MKGEGQCRTKMEKGRQEKGPVGEKANAAVSKDRDRDEAATRDKVAAAGPTVGKVAGKAAAGTGVMVKAPASSIVPLHRTHPEMVNPTYFRMKARQHKMDRTGVLA